MTPVKADLHSHTSLSPDCRMSYEEIIAACRREGLWALASTDHDTLQGARELESRAPFRVIVGCEIRTAQGDLIGLFLEEAIPGGMSMADTARAIREQGGVVYLPHPFDRLRRSAACRFLPDLDSVAPLVDVVEGINARCLFPQDNRRAAEWAAGHGLPLGAGSDAHSGGEIGQAYVEMEPFEDASGFLESIRGARLNGGLSPPWVHLGTTWAKLRRR